MLLNSDGRLFSDTIENGIDALVERIHYTTGGAFGEKGHTVMLDECGLCADLRCKVRQTIADEILTT